MELLTKKIEADFVKQGDTSEKSSSEIKVVCKLFVASFTWWLYERLDEHRFMCFANLGDSMMAELGEVDIRELQALKVSGIWAVERDMYYTPEILEDVIAEVKGFAHFD